MDRASITLRMKEEFKAAHGRAPTFRETLALFRAATEEHERLTNPLAELQRAVREMGLIDDKGVIVGLEALHHSSGGLQGSTQEVTAACESISIREVYDHCSKGKYGRKSGDEQMISCPNPDHLDENPSASMNEAKQVFHCYKCWAGGTDKYAIAAYAWGFPVPIGRGPALWEIKQRLASELRGVTLRPKAMQSADRQTPAPATEDGEFSTDFEQEVETRTRQRLIQLEADARAKQQRSSSHFTPPQSFDNLELELASPDPELEWTIDQLHGVGGNTTITAGFKVGKTTFVMNLIKALVDRQLFLGSHEVRPLEGRVAFWNFEVDEVQTRRTFREIGIRQLDRVWHLPLRGQPVNIMDEAAYRWTVEEMKRREVEVWILDPFSGAYFGDENDNSQITAFTKRLDQLKADSGVKDLFMPVHTGRSAEEGKERARGGAKLDDWADNRWILSKDSQTSDRYLRAEGRRVQQEERELLFQPGTHGLAYSPFLGTRKHKSGRAIEEQILKFVGSNPGSSQNQINAAVGGKSEATREKIRLLVGKLEIEIRPGPNNSKLHYLQGKAPIPVAP